MTERQSPEQLDAMIEAVDALRALMLSTHSFRQDLAAALGLAVSDTFALSHLAGGSLTAGELAQRAGLAPSSVTALVDRLERADLALRSVPPTDRRSQRISLTGRGRRVLTISSSWVEAGLRAIPEGNLASFTGQLRMLTAALRSETETFGATLEADSIDALLGR
jgi:DNA-binding MarR family transcriptional regulator